MAKWLESWSHNLGVPSLNLPEARPLHSSSSINGRASLISFLNRDASILFCYFSFNNLSCDAWGQAGLNIHITQNEALINFNAILVHGFLTRTLSPKLAIVSKKRLGVVSEFYGKWACWFDNSRLPEVNLITTPKSYHRQRWLFICRKISLVQIGFIVSNT